MQSHHHEARQRIEAIAALASVCRSPDADMITIAPSGSWTVHERSLVSRQTSVLDAGALEALASTLELIGSARAFSDWIFSALPGALGVAIVGERAPRAPADWLDDGAADIVRAHIQRAASGLIICPPGVTGGRVLTWLASQYNAEQIVMVSQLAPVDRLGPRVVHLLPPDSPGESRRLSRFLKRAPVVLWDGVEQPEDVRTAFGFAGATRRWMTLSAADPVEGIEVFASLRGSMPTRWLDMIMMLRHGPQLTHLLWRGGEGWREDKRVNGSCLKVVEEFFPSAIEQRTIASDWLVSGGMPSAAIPPSHESPGLRATMVDSLQERETSPNRQTVATVPEAAGSSSLHELFEDSDGSVVPSAVSVSHDSPTQPRNLDAFHAEGSAQLPTLAALVDQLEEESGPSVPDAPSPIVSGGSLDSPPTKEIEGVHESTDSESEDEILDELVREISSAPVDPYSLDPDEFLAPHEETIPSAGHDVLVPSYIASSESEHDPTGLYDVSGLIEDDSKDVRDSGEIDINAILSANQAVEAIRPGVFEPPDAITSNVPSKEFDSVLAKFGVSGFAPSDDEDTFERPRLSASSERLEDAQPHEPTVVTTLPEETASSPAVQPLEWGEEENTKTHSPSVGESTRPHKSVPDAELEVGRAPGVGRPNSSTSVRLSALSLKLKALRQQRREHDDQ